MTSEEIDVLAARIVDVFRTVPRWYEEQTEDSRKIRTRYEELSGHHSSLKADYIARVEWLRGVLAEAFGRGDG